MYRKGKPGTREPAPEGRTDFSSSLNGLPAKQGIAHRVKATSQPSFGKSLIMTEKIEPPAAVMKLLEQNTDLSDEEIVHLVMETLSEDELVELIAYTISERRSQ